MTQLQCCVLTFSPIVKGGGWVGVACFEGSLKLELSDSVLGGGEGALLPTPVGEGPLLVPAPLDVDVLPVAWCCLLLSRLGLTLVLREYGEWGGLCFTGALGSKISPSEWHLGEVGGGVITSSLLVTVCSCSVELSCIWCVWDHVQTYLAKVWSQKATIWPSDR